jgi:hypothetical protein
MCEGIPPRKFIQMFNSSRYLIPRLNLETKGVTLLLLVFLIVKVCPNNSQIFLNGPVSDPTARLLETPMLTFFWNREVDIRALQENKNISMFVGAFWRSRGFVYDGRSVLKARIH